MFRFLIWCLFWDTGTMERKEQLLEAVFGTMRSRQGSGCHVATSPRRDVGSTIQKSTMSPRRDVTTSRRRDVATLRRHHVATSPRRDVSSKICTSSFKVRMTLKLGYREAYERRHGFPEQSDTVFEEVPGICTAFHVCDIWEY